MSIAVMGLASARAALEWTVEYYGGTSEIMKTIIARDITGLRT